MDFGDISSRMKQARDKQQTAETDGPREFDHAESYRLRAKMLGVLVRDARLNAARTLEDCARLLKVTPQAIEAWELGTASPDLAQLELLAYYLDVPISHFWGDRTLEEDRNAQAHRQNHYLQLRHRMIGALLRQAREAQEQSLNDISQVTAIPVERLQQYELGEIPVPMSELPVLSNAVDKNLDYFLESTSYIGELLQIREEWKKFTDLDDDVRRFAATPSNYGFIKIAMMFSGMPTDDLRRVAEGMLDITM